MEKAVLAAAEKLDEMRAQEGGKLAEDLLMRGEFIRALVRKIEERAPMVVKDYTERLCERIRELTEDVGRRFR